MRHQTSTDLPGRFAALWPRLVRLLVAAGICLSAPAASAQDSIPPVPSGDLKNLEIPIWEEDNPDLRRLVNQPDADDTDASGVDDDGAADVVVYDGPADDPATGEAGSGIDRFELDPLRSDLDAAGATDDPDAVSPDAGVPGAVAAVPPDSAPGPLPDPAVSQSVIDLDPPDEASRSGRVFRVGLTQRGDPAAMLAALEPTRGALSEALGRPVEILPMASLSALIDAQSLRRVDLAFYSASAYAAADRLCQCVEPLVAPAAADGTAVIHAVVVVRRDSGLQSIDDLAGRTVAAAGAGSVGARLYQLASLKEEGIDPATHFAAILDAGNSADAVLEVRDGIVDAAFAWTSLAGETGTGYSRGTFTFLVETGQIDMADLSIIWQSRPLGHGPASVLTTMSEGDKAVVESFLSGLATRDPEGYDILDPYYGGGYQPVEPADYRGATLLAEVDVRGLVAPRPQPVPRERPPAPMPAVPPTIDTQAVQPVESGDVVPAPRETGSIIILGTPGED